MRLIHFIETSMPTWHVIFCLWWKSYNDCVCLGAGASTKSESEGRIIMGAFVSVKKKKKILCQKNLEIIFLEILKKI